MSEHTASPGEGQGPGPVLSPSDQFAAWVAAAGAGVDMSQGSVPPPGGDGATAAGSSGGWPWPAEPAPTGVRRRPAAVVVAAVTAVTVASFGFAAGVAYHRARQTAALPAAASSPSFGVRGGANDPYGLGGSGVSAGSGGGGSAADSTGSGTMDSAAATVASKVDPGIVDINTQIGFGSAAGAGTGMVLTAGGLILTNNHVVDGANSITVTTVENGHRYAASVVGTDPTEDIAVLQLKGASGLTTIPLGDSTKVAVGDAIVALGNAGGVGGAPVVATGVVVATDQTITASDESGANPETLNGLIVVNAPIQPGDSGGPLADASGRVIGMDTAASVGRGWRTRSGTGQGFAIPIDHALDVAHQIEQGQATATIHTGTTGFLGVALEPSTTAAVVDGVEPGSPAEAAGITAGDTVTAIAGQPVDSADTLSSLTKGHHGGDTVSVSWTDQTGRHHTAPITLAAGPAD